VVKMSMLVFWVVMQCGLVGRYRCFGGTVTSSSRLKVEAVWSSKRWYLPTSPHCVATQKTNNGSDIMFMPNVKFGIFVRKLKGETHVS
jgi:hypothetical protein